MSCGPTTSPPTSRRRSSTPSTAVPAATSSTRATAGTSSPPARATTGSRPTSERAASTAVRAATCCSSAAGRSASSRSSTARRSRTARSASDVPSSARRQPPPPENAAGPPARSTAVANRFWRRPSSLCLLREPVQQRRLGREDPLARLVEPEPLRAVDLRELLRLARPRRPLERERVRFDGLRVRVALERPCGHDLAALLSHLAEVDQFPVGRGRADLLA